MNFIQQAYKGKNEGYRYIITIILVFFGWQILGAIPLVVVAMEKAKNFSEFVKSAKNTFIDLGIESNLFLILIILTFIFGLIALFLGVKHIHKRAFKTLITSRKKIDWQRFWFSFFIWGIVSALMISFGIFTSPENYVWNFKPTSFFILVIISFLFLPIQTSFEELLFRGYLMQGIGILFKNKWMPLLFTSVLFGLLHGMNPEVEKLGYILMIFYIGTGFLLGIIALMDEGTELALGFHAINNIMAAFFVTTNWGAFKTDALYIDISKPSISWLTFFPVFVLYPILLLIFSKKYKWKNWKQKLFGNVIKPTNIE